VDHPVVLHDGQARVDLNARRSDGVLHYEFEPASGGNRGDSFLEAGRHTLLELAVRPIEFLVQSRALSHPVCATAAVESVELIGTGVRLRGTLVGAKLEDLPHFGVQPLVLILQGSELPDLIGRTRIVGDLLDLQRPVELLGF
jgi:hypothetical protein